MSASGDRSRVDVAICIPTYRRPIFLGWLLESVAALRNEGHVTATIVVDNDAAGSARPVVRRFERRIPRLFYEIEPERGISAARNRLATIARQLGAEFVAFVDDDERPEPAWLTNLLRVAAEIGASAVSGPVLPDFDDEVPEWIRAGGFFNRRRRRHGAIGRLVATSNLLVRLACLERLDGPFDRRFDLTGGGDNHMLLRLDRLGVRMVWADDAIVRERICASRATVRWIVRRRFRIGVTNARCHALMDPSPLAYFRRLVKASEFLVGGLLLLPVGLLRGRAATLRAICHCASGLGTVLGCLDLRYEVYREIDGR